MASGTTYEALKMTVKHLLVIEENKLTEIYFCQFMCVCMRVCINSAIFLP